MTDLNAKYEEAVNLGCRAMHPIATHAEYPELVRSVLDAIGFRALLEIEEAAREAIAAFFTPLDSTTLGQLHREDRLNRLRAALAARATKGEKM